jgi:3-oxoacyl-[acyl-carrier protein] reductase
MPDHTKVALVLGAVKGIGKAVGLALARDGVRVALNYFDGEEALAELQSDFAHTGRPHLILKTDLLDCTAIPRLVQRVVDHFGRLDIVVNNIERGGWPIVHGPYVPEQWDLEFATTLRAKRWVFECALPHLKASGAGVVVNFSSIAGIVGRTGPAGPVFNEGYAAANRGVSLLTETWARIGAPRVRVNEIMLGFFESRHGKGTRGWGLLSEAEKRAIHDHTLLGRTGNLEDVVKAVRFLVWDAPFMTGAVLRLDGGYVLGGDTVGAMPDGVL